MDDKPHSLFFVSRIENNRAFFSDEERHHALSVLRKGLSGVIHATDGIGKIYECLLGEGVSDAEVAHIHKQPAPLPKIHAFIGLPERDAFEEAITNLTALGIAKITPMVCLHCQQKWWLSWEKYRLRFEKKMVAGIKQSLGAWLPELCAPMEFEKCMEFVKGVSPEQCFVADAVGKGPRLVIGCGPALTEAICFIGPPGGFSQNEKDAFKAAGFVFVKIAATRLRTELASVALCSYLLSNSIVN
jgi:16S rRNA (uracil1498-N3)-methyltransferase